jgi:hypothetical protein
LPENLKVWGDLYICNTQIRELPENLQIFGNIFKDF